MKNQKGFTLIELMVVIVIIGILAAIAIPSMSSVSDKARASEAVNSIGAWENLQTAFSIESPNATGDAAQIGFTAPAGGALAYSTAAGTINIGFVPAINNCGAAAMAAGIGWSSLAVLGTPWTYTHALHANCVSFSPTWRVP